jgi:hemerythrin-like domain-containing protein
MHAMTTRRDGTTAALLESLTSEHVVIEQVALAFVAYTRALAAHDALGADAARFLRFFRLFAGQYHHAREEHVLFRALVDECGVPPERGPIAALLGDHADFAKQLDAIESLLASGGEENRVRAAAAASSYVSSLLHHVDAENSVLYPESAALLRRACVTTLADRAPDASESAALRDGLALVALYPPPAELPGVVRGDGCACCPRFGVSCDGVEREWSSDLEREDTIDRIG